MNFFYVTCHLWFIFIKIQVNYLSRTNNSNINLLVVESLKIFNKTLQEEGLYVWYIVCINQSQWVWFSNDFVNIYSYFIKFDANYTIFYELTLCINVVKLETYESNINGKL